MGFDFSSVFSVFNAICFVSGNHELFFKVINKTHLSPLIPLQIPFLLIM